MLTPTINTSSQTAATSRTTNKDLGKKDIFLKLLVAQMKNQNPLKPQDATKMSSQLAQFNMVDQQTKSNTLLQQLLDKGGVGSSASVGPSNNGASYLGHPVSVNSNGMYYNGSNQAFDVALNKPASNVLVFIADASGNPVRTMQLNALNAGKNALSWDGKTDSGATAPQGDYTIKVTATDVNGADVGSVIKRNGQVSAVRFGASGTELVVGGVAVPMANITEIRL